MNIIVAGGPDWHKDVVWSKLDRLTTKVLKGTILLNGGAGIAKLVEDWTFFKKKWTVIKFYADYDEQGPKAPYHTNVNMIQQAQALIAFKDDCPVTNHMIALAQKYGLKTKIVERK